MSWHERLIGFLTPPTDWQVFTPEWVVLMFALLAPLVAIKDTDRRGMRQFALIGLGGAFIVTLGTLMGWNYGLFSLEYIDWSARSAAAGHPVADAFRVTAASQFLKLIFLGVAFLAVYGAGRVLPGKSEEDHGEFHSLIMFATLGMMIVASAQELFTLLLGIELASMSSYLLATFRRDVIGAEASLKYFMIGAAASGMTLFGISLVYGATGTTHIATIGQTLTTGGAYDAMSLAAILLLFAGLAFKIGAMPFHAWAPDVYAGSPAPVAGMLAAGSKAMGFAALLNVFLVGLLGVAANWQLAIAAVAAVTMTVGNLVALQQQRLRRMLAYSSIAQAGYLLIAVVVAGAAASTNQFAVSGIYAVGGGLLHLVVNAAMKLGAFLVVGALLLVGIDDHMDGYKGLAKRAPWMAFAFAVFLLSMAGLPPLGGFTSKFVLFSSAVDVGVTAHLGWLVWLAVFAVVNSAISLFYYFRVIRNMYVEDGPEGRLDLDRGATQAALVCLAAVIIIGIYPQPFIEGAMEAAASLLGF